MLLGVYRGHSESLDTRRVPICQIESQKKVRATRRRAPFKPIRTRRHRTRDRERRRRDRFEKQRSIRETTIRVGALLRIAGADVPERAPGAEAATARPQRRNFGRLSRTEVLARPAVERECAAKAPSVSLVLELGVAIGVYRQVGEPISEVGASRLARRALTRAAAVELQRHDHACLHVVAARVRTRPAFGGGFAEIFDEVAIGRALVLERSVRSSRSAADFRILGMGCGSVRFAGRRRSDATHAPASVRSTTLPRNASRTTGSVFGAFAAAATTRGQKANDQEARRDPSSHVAQSIDQRAGDNEQTSRRSAAAVLLYDFDNRRGDLPQICRLDDKRRHRVDQLAKRSEPHPTVHEGRLRDQHVDRLA